MVGHVILHSSESIQRSMIYHKNVNSRKNIWQDILNLLLLLGQTQSQGTKIQTEV